MKTFGVTEGTVEPYRAIAYVTVPASENWAWVGDDAPGAVVSGLDVNYVTHINFAFGMIEVLNSDPQNPGRPIQEPGGAASKESYKNERGEYHYRVTLTGWIEEMLKNVDGREYLAALVKLKEKKPSLKVLLSVGGWDSDGFCYMAREKESRAEFIESLCAIIDEYKIDGVDIDWEFPTNGGWGAIASCAGCVSDACALLVETRAVFDAKYGAGKKLLTIASGGGQAWAAPEAAAALDYINVMCYDYDSSQSNIDQAPLFFAEYGMRVTAQTAGLSGAALKKLNLGVPFYNQGGPNLVPYNKEYDGYISTSPEILKNKMDWIKSNGYGGAFYWAYSMDVFGGKNDKILQKTVYEHLNR